MSAMRIRKPCPENLDAMPRAASGAGVHCTACDRDVVDLRRVPKKRALAVIAAVRAEGDGRICVRVRATPDGVPVFAKDPSPFARFALPAAFAGSLAACAPSAASERGTTPIAMLPIEQQPISTNANGSGSTVATVTVTSPVVTPIAHTPPQQPGAYPDIIDVAGEMVDYTY